jgi:hypothetical protein
VSCPSIKTCKWHTCDGVPGGWDCASCWNKRDSINSYKKEYNKEYKKTKTQKKD